jgi:hypothetical protein
MVVMEKAAFSFNTSYVKSRGFNDTYKGRVPVVLNWRVEPETCKEAQKNMNSYACVSMDSECVDTTRGKRRKVTAAVAPVGTEEPLHHDWMPRFLLFYCLVHTLCL